MSYKDKFLKYKKKFHTLNEKYTINHKMFNDENINSKKYFKEINSKTKNNELMSIITNVIYHDSNSLWFGLLDICANSELDDLNSRKLLKSFGEKIKMEINNDESIRSYCSRITYSVNKPFINKKPGYYRNNPVTAFFVRPYSAVVRAFSVDQQVNYIRYQLGLLLSRHLFLALITDSINELSIEFKISLYRNMNYNLNDLLQFEKELDAYKQSNGTSIFNDLRSINFPRTYTLSVFSLSKDQHKKISDMLFVCQKLISKLKKTQLKFKNDLELMKYVNTIEHYAEQERLLNEIVERP